MTFDEALQAIHPIDADFMFTSPTLFVCKEETYQYAAFLSIRPHAARQTKYFGGVIIALANRTDIRTIADAENKTIEAVSLSSLGGSQIQEAIMRKHGLDLLMTPRLVRISRGQMLMPTHHTHTHTRT